MTIKEIPRFEGLNHISVNVYMLEYKNREIFCVNSTYLTKDKKKTHDKGD